MMERTMRRGWVVGIGAVACLASCGGSNTASDASVGVDATVPVDASLPDASIPDAPLPDAATTDGSCFDEVPSSAFTARGAYAGAETLALTLHADAVLFEVTSARVTSTGEADPAVLQSYWSYSFVSPSTGVRINVILVLDDYQSSLSTVNPEGLLKLGPVWLDSDRALEFAVAAGFELPSPADPTTTMNMYLSPGEVVPGFAPTWEIERLTAPPGEPVAVERWQVTYRVDTCEVRVCPPTGPCVSG